MIERLTVFGVGLIGGSFAAALKRANKVGEVVGCGRNEANLQLAVELDVIDRYELDPAQAVQGADMIMLTTPLGAMRSVLAAAKSGLRDDVIITDGGSAKRSVVSAVEAVFGECPARFVPGHPIAGAEQSGVRAVRPDLYQQHRVILTPLAHTDPAATAVVTDCWEAAGAVVSTMDVEHHDEVLAATSHLPHVLAYALVDALVQMEDRREIFAYAAGGFRDFTRIASSDPVMWRDICVANRDAILPVIEQYCADLEQLKSAIADEDGEFLLDVFSRAKHARDRVYQNR